MLDSKLCYHGHTVDGKYAIIFTLPMLTSEMSLKFFFRFCSITLHV